MDKKKQIEEMACDICPITHICRGAYQPTESCYSFRCAKVGYEKGYSKQSEADVVKVVRCKDCKYHEKLQDGKTWCCRCGGMAKIRADGESFCSLAERREDETG